MNKIIKYVQYILPILILCCIFACSYLYINNNEDNEDKIFYFIKDHPELLPLLNNWKIIRKEVPKFDQTKLNKELVRKIGDWNTPHNKKLLQLVNKNPDWVTGWNKNWFHFPIIYMGNFINNVEKIFPNTCDILRSMPFVHVAGFSLLLPNSTLKWHSDETGKSTQSLAMNLGLDSEKSVLYVKDNNENIIKTNQESGKIIIFDSNYEHKVENFSKGNYRVILYIDFKTNIILGNIVKGRGVARKLGYPTINIVLDTPYKCGVYHGISKFGKVIIFIDFTNEFGECHFLAFDKIIDKETKLCIWNLNKINENNGGILGTYNKGCNK